MPIGEGRATAELFAPSWRHFRLCSGIADAMRAWDFGILQFGIYRRVLAYPGQMKLQSKVSRTDKISTCTGGILLLICNMYMYNTILQISMYMYR